MKRKHLFFIIHIVVILFGLLSCENDLTADYYRYLKALNCLDDDDYDTTLMEPVSLPSNVSGGIGFVGVATPREVVITFPERPCRNNSSSSF